MMRAFENRPDTAVVDEPFYAAYLAASGLDHPMRDEVLASQPQDWRDVAATLVGPAPGHAPVYYQKHMTKHMLPGFGTDWMAACCNVFLIRRPEEVVASYHEKSGAIELADIGIVRQVELFEQEAQRLGRAPLVLDSADVKAAPAATLGALCAALGLAFTPRHDRMAGRAARQRWRVGAGMVRTGRTLDRVRVATGGAAASAR